MARKLFALALYGVTVLFCLSFLLYEFSIQKKHSWPFTCSSYEEGESFATLGMATLFSLQRRDDFDLLMNDILHPQAHCKFPTVLGGKRDKLNRIDGDKVLCLDPEQRLHENCTVYSFGIGDDWSFDEAIQEKYKCRVYAFDPGVKMKDHLHSKDIHFYRMGISHINIDPAVHKRGWKMKNFESIKQHLGHSDKTIDVVKMDIEGGEYSVLEDMLNTGMLKKVKHLCVEIHLTKGPCWNRVLAILKRIKDEAGLQHFSTKNNTRMPPTLVPGNLTRREQLYYEMSWFRR